MTVTDKFEIRAKEMESLSPAAIDEINFYEDLYRSLYNAVISELGRRHTGFATEERDRLKKEVVRLAEELWEIEDVIIKEDKEQREQQ